VVLDLERLQSGDVLGSEVTGPLEVAGFLEGFDITDSAEFTHWKDRQQARLLPVIKDALLILIDRCRRTGNTRQIEQLADRMLALDELSEEAIRAKMEARAFAGDRLTALEIFEEWKAKLAEELHAVPSDLLEGMAVRLRRRGWERTTLTNIPNVPTDQWRGRPFIGRTAEYRVLYELWEGVKKGVPGHALILGDSGVGKTTLVQRLTTAAGLEGAAISRVQCYDVEREIPYSTLSSLIIGLLDRSGVSATAPEDLGELARIVPAVRHRFPNIPTPSDSQGEAARIRLTEAFQQMLTAISEEHPVVLVIDDLHLADDVSLAVLHLIMRRSRGQTIMVVLIARPGEIVSSSQAIRLRDSARCLGMREIELLPLSLDEGRDMLRSLVDSNERQPSASEQHALLRAAAGYPMALELLVQDWRVSGTQSLALCLDAMTAEFGSSGPAQASYRQILERITRSLNTTTHNVLNLAAILGQRMNDLGLYALVDLSAGQTMSSMAELVTRRVLRDGAQGLEFANELVRAAAYVGVPPTLRRTLHGNIADRLIQQHSALRDDIGLEIAWHCIRAGRAGEAVPHLLRGARQAIRSGAPYEAQRGLTTALPGLRNPDKSEALLLLAEALQEHTAWEESLHFLNQLGFEQDAAVADRAFILRARAHRWLGHIDFQELAELPAKLLSLIRSSSDTANRLRAAVEAASVLDSIRSCALAPHILDALSEVSAENLNLDDMTHLLLARSMLFYSMGDLNSSLEYIREARTAFEEAKVANSTLAMLENGIGAILTRQGAYSDSIPVLLQCYQTASRVGNDRIYLQASANLSLCFARLGEYEKAIEQAEQALTLNADGVPTHYFPAVQSAIRAYAMLGQVGKAEQVIQKWYEEFAKFSSSIFYQAWGLYLADGYAILGRMREAEEAGWRATIGENSSVRMKFCGGSYARWVARSSITRSSAERAYEKLHSLILDLNSYDLLDQAEILNAICWLDAQTGSVWPERVEEMETRLRAFPVPVRDQLTRMGMLDFARTGTLATKLDASRDLRWANSHV
jgi:tetratricopeptide (TPR) repeat protein/type II secretory pathway predicted ATPase ExeA